MNDTFHEGDSYVNTDENMENCTTERNPLNISVIMNCCFKFLNLEDIKNCRLVCRKWRESGEPFLKSLSAVKFLFPFTPYTLTDFNTDFQGSITNLPFTVVKIEQHYHSALMFTPESVLFFKEFLFKWRHNLKMLKLVNIRLKDEVDMTNTIYPTLTKLDVSCSSLIFQIRELSSIKFLRLHSCFLDIDSVPGHRFMSLEYIDISNLTFVQNDTQNADGTVINEYLNFETLKRVKLSGRNIIVDLAGFACLHSLELEDVQIHNIEKSAWKVDKLSLQGIPILMSNRMMYNELEFSRSTINLEHISRQIKRLILQIKDPHILEVKLLCESGSVQFPNLNHLCLNGATDGLLESDRAILTNCVKYFKPCENITHLDLALYSRYDHIGHIINVSDLPSSVKSIRTVYDVTWNFNANFSLDTLIFPPQNYNNRKIDVVSKLNVKNVVWELNKYDNGENIFSSEFQDTFMPLVSEKLPKIAIGPFGFVSDKKFKRSVVAIYVDTQGEYYLFQGQRGKVISKREFEKLKKVD